MLPISRSAFGPTNPLILIQILITNIGEIKISLENWCTHSCSVLLSILQIGDRRKNSPSGSTLFRQLLAPAHVNVFSPLIIFNRWLRHPDKHGYLHYNDENSELIFSEFTSVQLCFPSSTITGNLKSSLAFDSTLYLFKRIKNTQKVQHFKFGREKGMKADATLHKLTM